jgi:hypothetical protein
MYRLMIVSTLVGALGCVLLLGGSSEGQGTKSPRVGSPAATTSLVKFTDFQSHVKSAAYESYKGKKGSRVQSKAAFEKMRAHLLDRYKSHPVKHTFVQDGVAIDCVPINQQPALQNKLLAGHKLQLTPPAVPGGKGRKGAPKAAGKATEAKGGKVPGKPQPVSLGLRKGQKDKLGNEMAAPAGTIPIRRLTLDDLTRFRTLEEFQTQISSVRRQPARPKSSRRSFKQPGVVDQTSIRNTTAGGFQNVQNVGAQALLGLWQPKVPDGAVSSSQVTVSAGNQSIEAGWMVNPSLVGTTSPFLYVAADQGNGLLVLNLQGVGRGDRPLFVQTNPSIVLGSPLGPVSVRGGAQHSFQVSWKQDEATGNWFLFVGSVDSDNLTAVGYYPNSVFGIGKLSQIADKVFFGGRVIKTGGVFAEMGSGALPQKGANQAASQTNCVFFPIAGGFSLTKLEERGDVQNNYVAELHNSSGTVFDTFLFFGGDGVTNFLSP